MGRAVFHLMYQIQSSSHTGNRWQSRWPKSGFDVFRIYTYNHHRNGDENAFGQRLNEAPPPPNHKKRKCYNLIYSRILVSFSLRVVGV